MRAMNGSNNTTTYYVDGTQVYPCRCGRTHHSVLKDGYEVGDFNQYLIHNCEHDGETVVSLGLIDPDWEGLMCQCSARVYKGRPQ